MYHTTLVRRTLSMADGSSEVAGPAAGRISSRIRHLGTGGRAMHRKLK